MAKQSFFSKMSFKVILSLLLIYEPVMYIIIKENRCYSCLFHWEYSFFVFLGGPVLLSILYFLWESSISSVVNQDAKKISASEKHISKKHKEPDESDICEHAEEFPFLSLLINSIVGSFFCALLYFETSTVNIVNKIASRVDVFEFFGTCLLLYFIVGLLPILVVFGLNKKHKNSITILTCIGLVLMGIFEPIGIGCVLDALLWAIFDKKSIMPVNKNTDSIIDDDE